MTATTRALQLAGWLTAAIVLLPWRNACGDAVTPSDLIRTLQARGPDASLGDGGELLGRFVGTWSVDYSFHSKDGKVTRATGEFLAGWVMDGSAVQSLWIVDPRGENKDREIYTSLHYLDPKSGALYLTFIDPQHASPDYQPVARFKGTVEGEREVFLTKDLSSKGYTNRWSFDRTGRDSLVFRDEQSSDGGKTWRLQEEDRFTRRDAVPATAMHVAPRSVIGAI